MKKVIKTTILLMFFFTNVKSQIKADIVNYDSLIINKWKPTSININNKEINMTDLQKSSRLIFHKNHTSENKYNDLTEKGTWRIDNLNKTINIKIDLLPDEEISYNILSLSSTKLVFRIKNESNGDDFIFSLIPEK